MSDAEAKAQKKREKRARQKAQRLAASRTTPRAFAPTSEERHSLHAFARHRDAHPRAAPVEVDEDKLLRFLRANTLDVPKAHDMLEKHLDWMAEWQPNEVRLEMIETTMQTGCWRFMGVSKTASPVIWVQVKYWQPSTYSLDEYIRYISWFMAHAEKGMGQHGSSTHVVVFDMTGWSLFHAKYLSHIQALVAIAQNQYPERLEKAIMLNVPGLFQVSWKIISRWVDPRTREKVHFIDPADTADVLGELLSPSQTPACYGGACPDERFPVPNTEALGLTAGYAAAPEPEAAASAGSAEAVLDGW